MIFALPLVGSENSWIISILQTAAFLFTVGSIIDPDMT
jgi:hypothetical protein